MKIDVDYKMKDIIDLNLYNYYSSPKNLIYSIVLGFVVAAASLYPEYTVASVVIRCLTCLLIFLAIHFIVQRFYITLRTSSINKDEPKLQSTVSIQITGDKIIESYLNYTTTIDLTDVLKIVRHKNNFYIFTARTPALIIPGQYLDEQTTAEIQELEKDMKKDNR